MSQTLPKPSLKREFLPFTLQDVRLAIPARCFQSSVFRS
ncbi:MAG: fatty acid desaturase, partial [Microcystis sp.]